MKNLAKYLKGYRKESIIGPLFKLLEACFELIVPLVMANIIDVGIANKDTSHILKLGGVLILLGVLGLACSLTAQYFAARASMGFGTALRKDLYTHINSLSYTELDTIGTSTLITRITSDANQVQTCVNLVLRLFSRSPFIVIGALVMAFTIDAKMGMIFVIAIPLLAVVIYGIMLITMPIYKRVQGVLDQVSLITRNNLVGARVIRAFSRQKDEVAEFKETSTNLRDIQTFVGRISALLNPFTYVIVNFAIVAIIWQGGHQVYVGKLQQGEVIALVSYMTQILIALIALSNLIVNVTKGTASASRINDVFAVHTSMLEGTAMEGNPESEYKVEFDHVSFVYAHARLDSLTDVTLKVKAGQTIGIIGGTGDGKTTLVNMIPRFYDSKQGAVLVDGINVREYTYKALRSKIGIVPQRAVLFKGTIRENMKWGKKDATDEEIYKALEIAQAKEFVDQKPDGLDTMIMQGGQNLSGGQRQRLTIARALVGSPEILILDDSASALDFATDAKLRNAISTMAEKVTVFIVSQRATSIKHADQIVVLEEGKVVGLGSHEELLNTCEEYKEICLSQLSKEEVEAR
ncbi:MAG: ABC transporter ATP-binding protein [bacterium]|nr:ABC transporter ATP-binding protein [bacterium]